MPSNELPRDLKNPSYELFMLLLSLLSLFNIAILVLPNMDPLIKGVIRIMDIPITFAFMADFLYRLFTAESKSEYFLRGWGWADLLASMPFGQFKFFRIFRVVKAARLLRVYGLRALVGFIQSNRAATALFLTTFFVILVLEFGGAMIINVEAGDAQANIKTAGDGVWWAFVTITTVGYGDQYPVTELGRLVGVFTMALGVGLFGVLTGFLANAFIPQGNDNKSPEPIAVDPDVEMNDIRQLIDQQERVTAQLRSKLDAIEQRIQSEAG